MTVFGGAPPDDLGSRDRFIALSDGAGSDLTTSMDPNGWSGDRQDEFRKLTQRNARIDSLSSPSGAALARCATRDATAAAWVDCGPTATGALTEVVGPNGDEYRLDPLSGSAVKEYSAIGAIDGNDSSTKSDLHVTGHALSTRSARTTAALAGTTINKYAMQVDSTIDGNYQVTSSSPTLADPTKLNWVAQDQHGTFQVSWVAVDQQARDAGDNYLFFAGVLFGATVGLCTVAVEHPLVELASATGRRRRTRSKARQRAPLDEVSPS